MPKKAYGAIKLRGSTRICTKRHRGRLCAISFVLNEVHPVRIAASAQLPGGRKTLFGAFSR